MGSWKGITMSLENVKGICSCGRKQLLMSKEPYTGCKTAIFELCHMCSCTFAYKAHSLLTPGPFAYINIF